LPQILPLDVDNVDVDGSMASMPKSRFVIPRELISTPCEDDPFGIEVQVRSQDLSGARIDDLRPSSRLEIVET